MVYNYSQLDLYNACILQLSVTSCVVTSPHNHTSREKTKILFIYHNEELNGIIY